MSKMETLKQFNNNNNKNCHHHQSRKQTILQKRNAQKNTKKQQKQSIMKTSSSIICAVIAICQPPAASHALMHSRVRPDFIGTFTPTTLHRGTIIQVNNNIHNNNKINQYKTKLKYRNYRIQGDEDENRSRKYQANTNTNHPPNSSSNSSSNGSNSETQQQNSTTRHPRQQEQQQPQPQKQDHHISSFIHTLWTSGKSRRARELHALQLKEEQHKQYVLDDYLESIDRRYKRLHNDNENNGSSNSSGSSGNKSNSKGFTSALQWLTQQKFESTSELEEQRKQDDAIYVLGLAELASTRLLQRHQLPIPASKLKNKSVVIDIGFKSESLVDATATTDNTTDAAKSKVELKRYALIAATTAILSKATIIIHMLRKLPLLTHIKEFFTLSSTTVPQTALTSPNITTTPLRLVGKTLTQGIGSIVTFIKKTSGGQHSIQIASVMIATILAFAISVIRPVTKA